MSDNNPSSGVDRLSTLIFIVFLVLKLTDVIDWSWWWVTAPLWISLLIVVLIFIGVIIKANW